MTGVLPYLLVGIGGFLGANARLVVGRAVAMALPTGTFPLATLVINVSGSFLLGVLGSVIAARVPPSTDLLRLALGVGFLGAYTTFSTFELETHGLLDDGAWLSAAAYVGFSVFLGLLAVRVGLVLGRSWIT
ncbi:MAG: CrcB family protein [Vicinamibacterales bacterium]